ncbi:MAG: hypothetical protein ACRDI3_03845 [Actinomycetota bacterium]
MGRSTEQPKRKRMSKRSVLYVTIGVLLFAVALYLALRPDYQPLPSAAAGAMGAVMIEAGWARHRLSS